MQQTGLETGRRYRFDISFVNFYSQNRQVNFLMPGSIWRAPSCPLRYDRKPYISQARRWIDESEQLLLAEVRNTIEQRDVSEDATSKVREFGGRSEGDNEGRGVKETRQLKVSR